MIEHKFKKNYLAMIENSAKGENWMFRNFYIVKNAPEIDALEDGNLSCATFASSVLYLHNSLLEFLKKPHWIGFTHANTYSVVKDMLAHGWYEISDLRPGAIIVWEEMGDIPHLGFC